MARCIGAGTLARFLLLGLLIVARVIPAYAAQDQNAYLPYQEPEMDSRRTQLIALGYRYNVTYPEHLDRENIADLAITSMDLFHFALQDASDDPLYARIPKWGAAAVYDMAVLFTAHEYGHVSSVSKSGFHSVVFGDKDSYLTDQHGTNPWDLFISGLKGGAGTAVSVTNHDWARIDTLFADTPSKLISFNIAMKAGGLNQEEVLLDQYSERLWQGNLSYLDTVPTVVSAFATLAYPVHVELSDISDYSSLLREQGLVVSPSRIKLLSAISLLSGSTVASLKGAIQGFVLDAQPAVLPFVAHPSDQLLVEAPDMENYLSEFGPTLKWSVRMRSPWIEIQPTYEHLFVGGKSLGEFGFATKLPVTRYIEADAAGYRNSDAGWWQEVSVNLLPWKWVTVGVGYSWASGYTFHRDIYGSNNDLIHLRERDLKVLMAAQYKF